jgi:hypothetical protein
LSRSCNKGGNSASVANGTIRGDGNEYIAEGEVPVLEERGTHETLLGRRQHVNDEQIEDHRRNR